MRKLLILTIAVTSIALGSLAGCASAPEIRYLQEPLGCPMRPVLPRLTAEDLAPLSEEANAKLKERTRQLRRYTEILEAICWATYPPANRPDYMLPTP